MNPPLMTVMLSRLSNLEEYKTGAILRESECVLFQRGGTTLTAIQIRRRSKCDPTVCRWETCEIGDTQN